MAFRVKTSARAKRDLDGILAWLLAQGAGETGLRWFQGLREAVKSLAHAPCAGYRHVFARSDPIYLGAGFPDSAALESTYA
jgi:plasmid stabilization system protein ParE